MWSVALLLALFPAVCVAAPMSSSTLSFSVLIATSLALLFVLVAAKKKLSESQQTPSTVSVLQVDPVQERLAETRRNPLPVDAAVSLKYPHNEHQTGSIRSYDAVSDRYDVQLSTSETVTLQGSELQFPTVSGLFMYPIKSCAGISLEQAKLTPKGVLHDREWLIIDGNRDKFMTQRRHPKMALIRPKVLPSADAEQATGVLLTAKGVPDLEVPVVGTEGQLRVVTVWNDKVEAVDQGDAAAKWLDEFMGEKRGLRLVRVRDGFTRHTKAKYAPGHSTNFADAFPFLLALEKSLEQFNTTLETPIPMNRFRPNIVLRGSPPFADEHWNCITIDGFRFRNCRPCARCGMPSVDQATSEVHPQREPSRAIVRERNGVLLGFTGGKKVEGYFGSNMILETKESGLSPQRIDIDAKVKVLTLKKKVVA